MAARQVLAALGILIVGGGLVVSAMVVGAELLGTDGGSNSLTGFRPTV